mgnify:CR=1 FL=1
MMLSHYPSHQPELLPSLVLHILIFMTGVTGHVCLLYYLHTRHIKRHNINTGMFLASLSVAELLLLLVYDDGQPGPAQLPRQVRHQRPRSPRLQVRGNQREPV